VAKAYAFQNSLEDPWPAGARAQGKPKEFRKFENFIRWLLRVASLRGKETLRMSTAKLQNDASDQFETLFGKPPLLDGEDKERYQLLRAAIVSELNPVSVFDWINVRDQVDKLWEEERYKRAAAALIHGGLPKALDFYLKEICHIDYAEELIDKYHNGGAKGRKEVMSVLAEFGITMAELHAKAAQLEGAGLAMFDRMVAARESGRRLLRKEAQRSSLPPDPDPTSQQ
jgi:hypothetical protein